ncbi:YciE/YciF ferroxidase family protein [Paracoccus sp. (in: a-proteobacteria)]|uniref:YciE/YciF ferroxidase family protein n=1 Tax=Paracoccus sp. TaxID=267 RepID=UPI00272DB65C|nr:ferritin-like domain-containing protein [Paracoccus sp. (in: a-proteobacteria)]
MADQTLDTLFHETLKDIYYAERKIATALRKMARAAQNPDLKAAFETHEQETQAQYERLSEVFEAIGKKPRGKTCDAIEGIIAEGQEIMDEFKGSPALDAGLLAAAQAVEHYEIARYGTLKAWAKQLGLSDAERLLDQTLQEEGATDEILTKLAETVVNAAAETAES